MMQCTDRNFYKRRLQPVNQTGYVTRNFGYVTRDFAQLST